MAGEKGTLDQWHVRRGHLTNGWWEGDIWPMASREGDT